MNMDKAEIESLIYYAIQQAIKNDSALIDLNVSERAIMFHLARYIREKTPIEFHVDCEYNRHLTDIKKLIYLKNLVEAEDEHKVIPDILIHKRGEDASNLLVVELKKFGANQNDLDSDFRRLKAFKDKPYSYVYAVQIVISNAVNEPVMSYEFI